METADAGAAVPAKWEPWPARSRATVVFLPGERRAAEGLARRFFGRRLLAWEYAGLAGAPDEAAVEVGDWRGQLYLEMWDPGAAVYHAHHYLRRVREELVLVAEAIRVNVQELRGRGWGLHVFHRQAHNAARLGVGRIETVAGRRAGENGYYTWPRFGFDGPLPGQVRRILPWDLKGARTILDLMEGRRGREWWCEHGATLRVVFDLSPRSRSRNVLARYMRAKRGGRSPSNRERQRDKNSASGPKRNLENSAGASYGIAR